MGAYGKTEIAARLAHELGQASDPKYVGSLLRQANLVGIFHGAILAAGAPRYLPGYTFNPDHGRYFRDSNAPIRSPEVASLADHAATAIQALARHHGTKIDKRFSDWRLLEGGRLKRPGSNATLQSAWGFRRSPSITTTSLVNRHYGGKWSATQGRPKAQGVVDLLSAPYGRAIAEPVDTPGPSWEPFEDPNIDIHLVQRSEPILDISHKNVTVQERDRVIGGLTLGVEMGWRDYFAVEDPILAGDPATLDEMHNLKDESMSNLMAPVAGFLVVAKTLQGIEEYL